LQTTVGIGFSVPHTEEISDGSANDLFSFVAEFLQPVISDRDDVPVTVNSVQHRGRCPIKRSVFEICPRLIRYLRVHPDGTYELTLTVVINDGIGHAIDNFAGPGDEANGLVLQFPGSPQCRPQFVTNPRRGFRSRKIFGMVANHIFALVAQPFQHRVVDVEVDTVFRDERCHRWRLAKQPLVVILSCCLY